MTSHSTTSTSSATTSTARPRRTDVRSAILEAAAQAFVDHGYAATKVSDIAAAAGFTKGAVYSNFGGKPELFSAVCESRFDSVTGSALASSEMFTADEPAAATVRRIAVALADEVTRDPSWPSTMAEFRALATRDADVAAVYTRLRLQQRRDLEDRLRERARALRLAEDFDYVVAANLLLTCFNALSVEHQAAPGATPRTLLEDSFAQLLKGLLP